jgi:murein DD-endopeptidase MepM/ murein hydrolase activator NlpD
MMNQEESNMSDENSTSPSGALHDADLDLEPSNHLQQGKRTQNWSQTWENLLRMGLGEISMRVGTGMVSIALVLLVVWVMGNFYLKRYVTDSGIQEKAIAASLPTATLQISPPTFDVSVGVINSQGLTRQIFLHTDLPAKPRFEVTKYVVQNGDTIFGIAEKFSLRPETILWGNYYTLADDPHRLKPGQELIILPVDGVYYDWHAGDGLNRVAEFYGVKPENIVNFPGNNLNPQSVGDFTNPNIPAGTKIVVPGGHREFINWSAPRITRQNPAVAKIYGPGACGEVKDGPVGNGTFIWPTTDHYLSGYDYSPETNHYGIDISGNEGNPINAVDAGVVVYAGWNDWGYGNVVVIDHGNSWQSLYAHMNAYNVACGSYVYQGDVIGTVGSTGNASGPHLHFELQTDTARVNPRDFLPK